LVLAVLVNMEQHRQRKETHLHLAQFQQRVAVLVVVGMVLHTSQQEPVVLVVAVITQEQLLAVMEQQMKVMLEEAVIFLILLQMEVEEAVLAQLVAMEQLTLEMVEMA